MRWKNYEEVAAEYRKWGSDGHYAQSDIECLLWWLFIIVRLLFVLIGKDRAEPVKIGG